MTNNIAIPTMTIPVELAVQILDALYYPRDFEPKHLEALGQDLERLLSNYKEKV